jgi:tetratricopeptide (TPR) repeat protein
MKRIAATVILFSCLGFQQGVAQATETPANPAVSKLDSQAKEAFAHQNYDAAIKFASAALQMAPQSFVLRYRRGVAYYRKGDTDKAIQDCDAAIRLRPAFAPTYVDRGAAYMIKGWTDKALRDFNEAIRLNPKDARAYCDRADLEVELNQPDKALSDYNYAIRLAPNFQRAHFNRAARFAQRHDYARAIADYTQSIRLSPNDLAAHAARATLYAKQGDRTRALADATTATKLKPTTVMYQHRAVDLRMRASAYKILSQPDLALRDLREAIRLVPRDPGATGQLAWFLATCPEDRFRNGAEAVASARKACELSHWDDSDYIDTLAAAYAETGDFDRATKFQQQSLNDRSLAAKHREKREERLRLYQQRKPFRERPDGRE